MLSTEDYLLTKLARQDRSAADVQDVLQIIIFQKELEWDYLIPRLKKLGLLPVFKPIVEMVEKHDPEFRFPENIFL
ncbi:MAG: hypothetical protein ACFFD4_28165 [Candidatus Odinarchaeota archaeon]